MAALVERLAPLIARGVVLDLAAMRAALRALGDPQARLPAVHVAGTNGKGSVTAMVDAALRAGGQRAGRYTSPHLHRFVERIAIDGEPVDEAAAQRQCDRLLAMMADGSMPTLTFFEAATALAWMCFAEARVERVVLEVGLGGRLDATNVCAPEVTAITGIALDHQGYLGDTLAAIAAEKAGILKPGVPCVLGPTLRQPSAARAAIEAVARRVGAPLFDAPAVRVRALDAAGASLEVDSALGVLPVTVKLGGAYQVDNVATAVGVLDRLRALGRGVDGGAVRAGLAAARWPGRMERVGDVILDGGHNLDGVAALCATPGLPPVAAIVFGASSDKPWREMLARLIAAFPGARRCFAAAP
ncbi:MAG: Dihydrofolate synthase, partial [Myxococcaceae bacterium]|nr:Dihydrofolate synthase [Myxococcaceae bacterium]